jgi:uncharacterized Zn-finger protein
LKHCKNYNWCNICLLNFDTENLLMEHMKIHSDVDIKSEVIEEESVFKCSDCNMTFSKLRSLAMHKKKHKNNKEKSAEKFQCDICSKEFRLKALLRRHVKVHSTYRPFSCSICPKRYTRDDQLQDHMRTHSNMKPNVCSYCNKGNVLIV